MFTKADVNGIDTQAVYTYLKYNSSLYIPLTDTVRPISWNFGKFLVDAEGHVINYWEPVSNPLKLVPDIEECLGITSKAGDFLQ